MRFLSDPSQPFVSNELTVDPSASNWLSLDGFDTGFGGDAGGAFAPGVLATQPLSGALTAFGFYFDNPQSTNYGFSIDAITVTSVPANGALMFPLGLLLLSLARKDRRRC